MILDWLIFVVAIIIIGVTLLTYKYVLDVRYERKRMELISGMVIPSAIEECKFMSMDMIHQINEGECVRVRKAEDKTKLIRFEDDKDSEELK